MSVESYAKDILAMRKEILKIKRVVHNYKNNDIVVQAIQDYYHLCWLEIHTVLAPKNSEEGEAQIRAHIKDLLTIMMPIVQAKIKVLEDEEAKYAKNLTQRAKPIYDGICKYLNEYYKLYEDIYALVAFRSLTHFANFMEWDLADKDKVWKYSIDPNLDNGWTGVNFPFFYYFNKMVLAKDIKFISKQYPTGYGKCVAPTTEVLTPTGCKMIKDIEVGDFVCSMKDNKIVERKVLNKWYSTKKQMRLTTRGGKSIIVSPEHRMYTQNGYVMAKDITTNDYLYRLCTEFETKNPIVVYPNELVFVSCLLFEGHCKSSGYGFSQMPDTMIGYDFCRSCDELGIKYSIYSKKGTKCLNYRIWQNDHIANEILQRYGLDGKLANEKRLPKQFFDMDLVQKYQFIGIMLATDGYISKTSQVGISLASKGLVYDIQKLLDSCGIYASINKKTSILNGKSFDAWALSIPNEYLKNIYLYANCYDKTEKLRVKYENSKNKSYCNNTNYPKQILGNCKEFKKLVNKQWKRNKTFKRNVVEQFAKNNNLLKNVVYHDFVWEQIKSIEFIDENADMIDIEVEETHNFIANNLVSHNSYSNVVAISWLLGVDPNNDCLVVLGNPALVLNNTKGVCDMLCSPRYAKVFPVFKKYHDEATDSRTVKDKVFSVCRTKEGELTLAHSRRTVNLKIISKDTAVDGIRVRFLFLDDVCRSKDAGNNKQHEIDISNFWNSWWKRNYNTDDFYIIVGGTAYSIYDIISVLKNYYAQGKIKKSRLNKYTNLSIDEKCVFISIPKLDPETDESTYPQKFPTVEARRIRERNLRDFMAMEQQMPQPPETSPFYWDNLNTYDVIPEERSKYCWAAIDPVRIGGDNFAMPIFVQAGDKYYLKDCIYQAVEPEKIYATVVAKIIQHNITQLVIERNTDTSLKRLLDDMLNAQGVYFCNIIEVYNYEKKEIRITNMQNTIKTQLVFPAEYLYAHTSEMGLFMYDIVSFSWDMSKNKHDDSIDATTMYCEAFLNNAKQMYASIGTFRR